MCVTSNVGDYYRDSLPSKPYWPTIQPFVSPSVPAGAPIFVPQITRQEFDQLKHDVEELKKLLVAAKRFDEATGEPDCEVEDKVTIIRKLAGMVGVSMEEIFGPEKGA
jgi:hypothetical protein